MERYILKTFQSELIFGYVDIFRKNKER